MLTAGAALGRLARTLAYEHCVGFDKNMWTEIVGSSYAMLEIAGAKNVRVRMLKGGDDGDDTAEMDGHWD